MNGDSSSNEMKYYTFPPLKSAAEKQQPTLEEVGGKGLSLYDSSCNNFPVPLGFVLAVSFFESWMEQVQQTQVWKDYWNKISKKTIGGEGSDEVTKADCDAIKTKCLEILKLNEEQSKLLQQAILEAFGNGESSGNSSNHNDPYTNLGIVAVRSSSPEEDLFGTSFAGGYETTLGITSETLHDAILHSFASMYDYRVHLYKMQQGMTNAPRIAIVIQRQIPSEISGVAFSINPSNNCYDEIMISANYGLGESVVGGIVTPDTYVVDRSNSDGPSIVSKNVAEKKVAIWLNSNNDASCSGTDDEATNGNVCNGAGGTHTKENAEPNAQALSDEQILEVASLVSRVEEQQQKQRLSDNNSDNVDSSVLVNPVDIEWAFHKGKLYLLQARPVTAYIPLFPEMLTKRGEEKRLYLDIMVLSQGFSDPLSVLGLDLWRTVLARMKPTMSTEGKEGLMFNIHGREYMNISNMLKMTGGHQMVNNALKAQGKQIQRAIDSIDLSEYTPSHVPEGTKGIFWKTLKQLVSHMPSTFRGLYSGSKAMESYVDGSNAIIEKCASDACSKEELFSEAYDKLMIEYEELCSYLGGLLSGMISRWVLHRMFAGCEGVEDHLINMCMDLNGNPTSEMGHFMVKLAKYPEIQETKTSDEFMQNLNNGSFSDEFMADYNKYLKYFGCRGMREIDAATPRTYENQSQLFDTLKQIDVEENQIINVRKRRDVAYNELLKRAKDMGKEKRFVHHADIIQSLWGYREHPKYMLVVMIDRMRRHALNIADEFVQLGRLENREQIFALTIEQVTQAQKDPNMDLIPLVVAAMEPIERVAHIKTWPVMIDSRGKIIRGVRKVDADTEEGILLGDPISPGIARGKAKVLMSPYEKPLESGEVLIARFTEPSWTPLFINTSGVVMEVGGPMQHGAIIAREYGIPCVSGLDNATQLINDGDLIEVDGSAGTVRIIENQVEDDAND